MSRRAATVPIEIAHRGLDGVVHGHSLSVEVWTNESVCLEVWHKQIVTNIAYISRGMLEETIGGRTFEDVGVATLDALGSATKVVIRLPTLGYSVEVCR